MMERDHDRDALQCRVKVKELWNAYHKAREADCCSSAAPATCRFYKELDTILGGDPTSTPSTTMDTSEPSSTKQEEEAESGSEGAEEEEDPPASLDACSQELFSSQEEDGCSTAGQLDPLDGNRTSGQEQMSVFSEVAFHFSYINGLSVLFDGAGIGVVSAWFPPYAVNSFQRSTGNSTPDRATLVASTLHCPQPPPVHFMPPRAPSFVLLYSNRSQSKPGANLDVNYGPGDG
ncbi:hypothetical protein UY3_15294 [Chelonia mydas]|uniref:Uncharacterized protein n=1 Tax=Chelonia mydas TaxID=8469 RepID=M7AQM4_CHEMY|nr:hypothetical protein UY3_15294 [Chelonia mydas]